MGIQDLDVLTNKTQLAGEMINVNVLLRNGQTLTLTDELRKFKIRSGVFTIEFSGRFNFVRVFKLRVDMIRFSLSPPINLEDLKDEERIIEDAGSRDGEEGIREFDSKVVGLEPDKKRKRDPYNFR